MANAPSTSPYLTFSDDTTDLPNSKILVGSPNIVIQQGSSSSQLQIAPSGQLSALANVTSTGLMVYNSTSKNYGVVSLTSNGSIAINQPSGLGGNPFMSVVGNTSIQKVQASVTGVVAGARQTLNFIGGTGVGISIADDSTNDRLSITISAAGGGGGGAPVAATYWLSSAAGDTGLTSPVNLGALATTSGALLKVSIASGTATPTLALASTTSAANDYAPGSIPSASLVGLGGSTTTGSILYLDSAGVFRKVADGTANTQFLNWTGTGFGWVTPSGTGSGAPVGAQYWIGSASGDTGLTNPTNIGSLGTTAGALLKVVISGGVTTPSLAVAGTDYVAPSANLTALSAVATTGYLAFTAAGTVATRAFTSTGGTLTLTNANGVSAATNFEVTSGLYQASSANLTALSSVTTNGFLVYAGSNTFAERSFTSSGSTIAITNPTGVGGNVNLEVVGGPFQAQNANLTTISSYTSPQMANVTALSGVTTTGYLAFTAAGTVAPRTFTSSGSVTIGNPTGIAAATTFDVAANTTNQKVQVALAGTVTGTRKEINFIQGANVTLTVADNSGSDRVDVTIAASGGGGGGVTVTRGSVTVTTGVDPTISITDTNITATSLVIPAPFFGSSASVGANVVPMNVANQGSGTATLYVYGNISSSFTVDYVVFN